jgi:hypothetical protein
VPKDLASAVAAVVGSLPGLTLPFVAELVLGPRASDLLLLALSPGHHPVTDRQLGHRLPTVAEYGRLLGRRLGPHRRRVAPVPVACAAVRAAADRGHPVLAAA